MSVHVTASRRALEQWAERGIARPLENVAEQAIARGQMREHTLTGRRLEQGLRHVVLDAATAAIVAKDGKTSSGRPRFRVVGLLSLRPRRAACRQ